MLCAGLLTNISIQGKIGNIKVVAKDTVGKTTCQFIAAPKIVAARVLYLKVNDCDKLCMYPVGDACSE